MITSVMSKVLDKIQDTFFKQNHGTKLVGEMYFLTL